MAFSVLRRTPAWILCAGLFVQALAASPGEAALAEARNSAAACLARDYDGRAFRDPYLRYVYPEEKLAAPPADPDLTYRRTDADIMLALLERESSVPAALRMAAGRAARVLHELPPLWAGKGLNNVRREPRPDGTALDTFCIVGWIEGDRGMAREVARALDGDGWLAEGLYEGEERFRRDADEAWCLRLLASSGEDGLAPARQVLDRLVANFRQAREEDPAGRQTFYAAYHLALLLEEPLDRDSGIDAAGLRRELEEAMEAWALARPEGQEPVPDLLEWANLVTSKLPGLDSSGLRRRGVGILLRNQEESGCWRVPGARPSEAGSSFLTLRALLALSAYREP